MCARRRTARRGASGVVGGGAGEGVALRDTALAISRDLEGELECNREQANRLWQELVAARLAFVDRFERDGRQYLVARWKEGTAPSSLIDTLDRLILAQRAVGLSLKVIAYEIGLSISAVGRRLQSCMARLGVSNPAELASLFGGRPR